MNPPIISEWLEGVRFEPVHVDCAIAVMLKILDGKCKMNPEEKTTMTELYLAVKNRPGKLLGSDLHHLITRARTSTNEDVLEQVYEQRLYAEQMISRPVMKAFKAMLREHGIID